MPVPEAACTCWAYWAALIWPDRTSGVYFPSAVWNCDQLVVTSCGSACFSAVVMVASGSLPANWAHDGISDSRAGNARPWLPA